MSLVINKGTVGIHVCPDMNTNCPSQEWLPIPGMGEWMDGWMG